MSHQSLALPKDDPQLVAQLTECEMTIQEAVRRGIDAACDIGRVLNKIELLELYLVKHETFALYVEKETRWDRGTVKKMQTEASVRDNLQEHSLPLPENETMLLALGRLEPEVQAQVWDELLSTCERIGMEITEKAVQTAVNVEERKAASTKPVYVKPSSKKAASSQKGTGGGVNVDLGLGAGQPDKGAPEPPQSGLGLSEEGEAALEKIGRLCGDFVRKAIENRSLTHLNERDLITWAEQNDHQMRNLAHYVINKRWTVDKSLKFDQRIVNNNTTLDQLTDLARARGGHLTIRHEEFELAFRRLAQDAA
jgi:hypothetical protein